MSNYGTLFPHLYVFSMTSASYSISTLDYVGDLGVPLDIIFTPSVHRTDSENTIGLVLFMRNRSFSKLSKAPPSLLNSVIIRPHIGYVMDANSLSPITSVYWVINALLRD